MAKMPTNRLDLARTLRALSRGKHIPEVSTMKGGYRRISAYWLATVAARIEELEAALSALVDDWHSVPLDVQVPDEINEDEHWEAARKALGIDGDPRESDESDPSDEELEAMGLFDNI
jgi:hypothetical protein